MTSELGEARHDRGDDQLGRHELPERELARNHEPAANPQQRRAGDGLHRQRADQLAEDDPEVLLARRQIGDGERLRARARHQITVLQLERLDVARRFLEPRAQRILGLRLLDRRRDRASTEDDEDAISTMSKASKNGW